MSRELLIELQKECIELAAGGSELAIGNFKLQKLLPKFEKLGQKIKPFKMVYARMNTLLNSEKNQSEDNLISLISLVNAILFTQAETEIEGELEVLQGTSMKINTNVSNHLIAPVANALTTKGGGRYNIIEEAFKEGLFSDFRLIPLLIKGLDDTYVDISEMIHKELSLMLIPDFLPLLKESFNKQGKRGDAFKLNLMGQILGEEARDLCIDLLEDSSKEVKVEAVNILGNLKNTENILLEQAKSKAKEVRRAAYFGLVKIDSENVRNELLNALKKTDYDIVLEAIRVCDSYDFTDLLLTLLKEIYPNIEEKKEKVICKFVKTIKTITKYKNEEVFEFLIECFKNDNIHNLKSSYYEYANEIIANYISEYDNTSEEVRNLLESKKDCGDERILPIAFEMSLKTRQPEEVYEMYSSYFNNIKIYERTRDELFHCIEEYIECPSLYEYGKIEKSIIIFIQPIKKPIDKRWLGVFRKYEIWGLFCYIIEKEDIAAADYIIDIIERNKILRSTGYCYDKEYIRTLLFIALIKIDYENIEEFLFKDLKDYSLREGRWLTQYRESLSILLKYVSPDSKKFENEIEQALLEKEKAKEGKKEKYDNYINELKKMIQE